jgi:FkbM family methyltransferase
VPWQSFVRVRAEKSRLVFYTNRRCVSARHISKYGEIEPRLTQWLASYLTTCPPGLFIDAGANIGWHSLHVAALPGVEQVVAYEADPTNGYVFDRNRAANNITNMILVVAALGDRRGTARLNRYKASNTGRHSIAFDHGMGSIQVPLVDLDSSLDDLGLGHKPIAVLKIDVEGYEPAVIAGARRAIGRTQVILMEVSRAAVNDGLVSTLREAGLFPFVIDPDGRLVSIDSWPDDVLDIIWMRKGSTKAPNVDA